MPRPNHTLTSLPTACTRWWVALSGGLDSKVLLHRILAVAASRGGRNGPRPIIGAVHLRHFLEDEEPAWEDDCRRYCAALNVPLVVLPAASPRADAQGLEAAARQARLIAWQEWGRLECLRDPEHYPEHTLWLAQGHHAHDLAETLLHRLGRGAGSRGLAVLPAVSHFHRAGATLSLFRPLLHWRKEQVVAYAAQHGIQGADDPANRDPARTRTHLRQTLLPAMLQVFPAFLQRAGELRDIAQMESELLHELAKDALAALQVEPAFSPTGEVGACLGALSRTKFLAQSEARQMLTFRHWWQQTLTTKLPNLAHHALSFRRLKHVLANLRARPSGHLPPLPALSNVRLIWQAETLMLWQNKTLLMEKPAPPCSAIQIHVAEDGQCAWAGGQLHWRWQRVDGVTQGVSRQRLTAMRVMVTVRQSADVFHPQANRPLRSLRKWMNERRIPIHLRAQLPMIRSSHDGTLIAALGVGVQAEWLANTDEPLQLVFGFDHPDWDFSRVG